MKMYPANGISLIWKRHLGHAVVRPGHVGLPSGLVGSEAAVSSQPPSWWEMWCGAIGRPPLVELRNPSVTVKHQ